MFLGSTALMHGKTECEGQLVTKVIFVHSAGLPFQSQCMTELRHYYPEGLQELLSAAQE